MPFWITALIVPALATFAGPWIGAQLGYGAGVPFGDPGLLTVRTALAAAPLLALALFAATERADRVAARASLPFGAVATLLVWGWYHLGSPGAPPLAAGLILMASPALIGLGITLLYIRKAR